MLMGCDTSETLFALIGALPENTIWEALCMPNHAGILHLGNSSHQSRNQHENLHKNYLRIGYFFPNDINLIE
jgi:hypothetical protein